MFRTILFNNQQPFSDIVGYSNIFQENGGVILHSLVAQFG